MTEQRSTQTNDLKLAAAICVSCCGISLPESHSWISLDLTQAMVGVLPAAQGESHTRMAFHGVTKLCGAHCSVSSSDWLRKNTGQPHRVLCPGSLQHQKKKNIHSSGAPNSQPWHCWCCSTHLREGSQDLHGKSESLARQVMMARAQLHVSVSKWHLHQVSSISRDCMYRLLHLKCAPRMRTQRTVI